MSLPNRIHVGFSYFDVFLWAMVGDSMREAAEYLGIRLTTWNSLNAADQLAGITKMIDQEVDALIVSPVTSDQPELLNQINRAQARNIHVLVVDSEITGTRGVPYLGSDHFNGQASITEMLFKQLAGAGRVAHIQGRLQLDAHNLRSQGFHRVLERYPSVELVFEKHHDPSLSFEDTGRLLTREILSLPEKPQAIVAATDRIALGVAESLAQAQLTDRILVTGFDGIPHVLRAIREGALFATVGQDVDTIAERALALVLKMVARESVPERTLVGAELITGDNVVDAALKALHYMPGMLDRVAEDNRVRRRLQQELTDNLELQKQLVVTLRTSEERFRSLAELSSDWYWEQDENFRFVSGDSDGQGRFHGSNVGKTRWELPYADMTEERWAAHKAELQAHRPFRDLELKREGKDGEFHYITVSGEPIFDHDGKFCGYRGVGRDVTERRRAHERIEHLAFHDVLTGLPNRSYFARQVNQALKQAKRYDKKLAILFIDLDRFKIINDTLGHEAGDQLLQEVANRLRNCLREGDVVSRLGGDEFVVLLEEVLEHKYIAAVASKILSNVVQSFSLGGHDCQVTASIGVSIYPQDGEDEQSLMKNADIAMYQAKEKGKNDYAFYSVASNIHSFERLSLESNLRKALQNNELLLHYQAKGDIHSGEITGMEALLRWQHPEHGLMAPADFIPLAEETGLIIPIGKWVLHTACSQNVAWQRQGLPRLCMAVNLSPRQFFDANLVKDVTLILDETGMDAGLLELEITESMVMYSADKAIDLLSALKAMGVNLAIDDFGTGYSSFALLKRFPIDAIKIDRSFIQGLPTNDADNALASAIISMGKALKLKIVAEGVEKKEQLKFLQANACDEMQGFYFSRPMSAADIGKFLTRSPARQAKNKSGSVRSAGKRATKSVPRNRA